MLLVCWTSTFINPSFSRQWSSRLLSRLSFFSQICPLVNSSEKIKQLFILPSRHSLICLYKHHNSHKLLWTLAFFFTHDSVRWIAWSISDAASLSALIQPIVSPHRWEKICLVICWACQKMQHIYCQHWWRVLQIKRWISNNPEVWIGIFIFENMNKILMYSIFTGDWRRRYYLQCIHI